MKKKTLLLIISILLFGNAYSQKGVQLSLLKPIDQNQEITKITKASVYVRDSVIYYGTYSSDWEPSTKDITLAFDNSGRVTSVEHYTYSTQWEKQYLLNTTYMSDGRLDIYLKFPWNSNTLSYEDDTAVYYNMLPYTHPLFGDMYEDKIINLSWDYATNQFTGGQVGYIDIISDSLYDNMVFYDYDASTSLFYLTYQYYMSYNSNNLLEYYVGQEWVDSTSSWINDEKNIYAYDANGNLIQEVDQVWDNANGSWENDYKYTYTYDANNNKTSEFGYNWDNSINDWVGSYKYEYTYDANNNMLTKTYYNWDNTANDWVENAKYLYQYDGAGNEIEYIAQYWDNTTSSWVNNHRQAYTYDVNNNMTEYIYSYWDNTASSWTPYYKIEYTYNANNDKLTEKKLNYNSGSWENNYLYTYTYDSAYNRLQDLYQTWDNASSSWANDWKRDYYYSLQEVSGVSEASIVPVSVYPNPTNGVINIDNSMAKIKTLSIYDMTGRRVYADNNLPIEKVQIDLSKFGSGIYTLKMKDKKGNIQSKRIIVK